MGLYLYGCYTPKRNVTVQLPDGQTVRACLYRFITKPYHDNWREDIVTLPNDWGCVHRMTAMKVAKIFKLWEGIERPKHALHVMDSEYIKEHGAEHGLTGSLHVATTYTPVVWLEEYSGTKYIGECRRVKNGLWAVTPPLDKTS